jgi:Ubiquitin fold domain
VESRQPARIVAHSLSRLALQSEERLPMRFSALVEHVTKKPVAPHITHFLVEVMASDEEGEDVEVHILYCISSQACLEF